MACVKCGTTQGEFVNPDLCKECRTKLDEDNAKRKKTRVKAKNYGLVDWFINDEGIGLLRIEPKEGNYARGAVKDDGLYFEDEIDAIQQLTHLLGVLQDRIRIARYCWKCQTEITHGNMCPKCGADNEDK